MVRLQHNILVRLLMLMVVFKMIIETSVCSSFCWNLIVCVTEILLPVIIRLVQVVLNWLGCQCWIVSIKGAILLPFGCGLRKDEASGWCSVVAVSAVSFLQCFNTVGWVTERAFCLQKSCATYHWLFCFRISGGRKRGGGSY